VSKYKEQSKNISSEILAPFGAKTNTFYAHTAMEDETWLQYFKPET
jgi:hypothetical protein